MAAVLVFTIVIFIEFLGPRYVPGAGGYSLRTKVIYDPLCQIYFIALFWTQVPSNAEQLFSERKRI